MIKVTTYISQLVAFVVQSVWRSIALQNVQHVSHEINKLIEVVAIILLALGFDSSMSSYAIQKILPGAIRKKIRESWESLRACRERQAILSYTGRERPISQVGRIAFVTAKVAIGTEDSDIRRATKFKDGLRIKTPILIPDSRSSFSMASDNAQLDHTV